jgi:hypothetical protein
MQGTKRAVIFAAILIALTRASETSAIEGLKIQVQCPNVILSWPSVQGETYIVRWQPSIGAPWTNLTTSLPAAGGNTTTYTHVNGAPCPAVSPGGGPRPSPNPPPPGPGSSRSAAVLSSYSASNPIIQLSEQTVLFLANHSVYPPFAWDTEERPPEPWELEARPPYPWERGAVDRFEKPQVKPQGHGSPQGDPGFYEVVRVGVRLFGFNNGMVLSGQVALPVEFGNTDTNGILSQAFLLDANGNDIQGAGFSVLPDSPPLGNLNGVWDTTQTTNGQYQIQLGAQLTDGAVYYDRVLTVTVANHIWFPDPFNVGGKAIYIGAETVHTNGTWQMSIYDDHNRLVGNLSGTNDGDGFCDYPGFPGPGFSLNNTDSSGNQNPSTAYTFVITASNPAGAKKGLAGSDTSTNMAFIEPGWDFAVQTKTVVAYMEFFASFKTGYQDEINLLSEVFAIEDTFHPNLLGSGQIPFQIQVPGDWSQVTNAFANTLCRDFYYFGHGSGNAIGDNATFVKLRDIQALLQNNQKNPLQATNMHAFRFVFLDGCNTADGSWPQTFGIPRQPMSLKDFGPKRGIRPRAFMGWNYQKQIGNTVMSGAQLYPPHVKYVTTFWNTWAALDANGQPTTVAAAITAALQAAPLAAGGMQLYGAKDLAIQF